MNCEQAVDRYVDSLMDTLDDDARAQLAAHLRTCAACTAETEALRWQWEALGRLASPAPAASRWRTPWLRAAAALALFALGGAAGFALRGGPEPGPEPVPAAAADRPAFLLLVRGDTPGAAGPEERLVREYAAWADTLAHAGRLLGAEKLRDEPGRWISGDATDTRVRSDVSGYFLLTAADYPEAVELARRSPHVRYGGTFEIRQVDRLE